MGRALELLGYQTQFGPWWPKNIMIADPWYEHPEEWPKYYPVIKKQVELHDAFQDYPWMFLYRPLTNWYPDAKFILLQRDPDGVADSEIKMWRRNNVPERDIPDAQAFKDRYLKHREDVLSYFSSSKNLLDVSVKDPQIWQKLCTFLGKKVPTTQFPHLNKAK